MRPLLALVSLLLAAAPASARPLNLLLISVDTLDRAALRAFNPAAAPLAGYDELAADSQRFANAVSTSSWTLPAHGSMMTGLYPWRHGGSFHQGVVSAPTTRAAGIRRHGYRTIGLTDGGFVEPRFGFRPGFDFYDNVLDGPGWPAGNLLPHSGGHGAGTAVAAAPVPGARAATRLTLRRPAARWRSHRWRCPSCRLGRWTRASASALPAAGRSRADSPGRRRTGSRRNRRRRRGARWSGRPNRDSGRRAGAATPSPRRHRRSGGWWCRGARRRRRSPRRSRAPRRVRRNEVVGRSAAAMAALGTHSLQDSIMLSLHASPEWRDRYLGPLVAGEVFPSFAMTEPAVACATATPA